MQKFYCINHFLWKEVAHKYLNTRRLDMVAKVGCNEFSKPIFWAEAGKFLLKSQINNFFCSATCLENKKKKKKKKKKYCQ